MDGPLDHSGIVVDGSGTPMLTCAAEVDGQYATDSAPCDQSPTRTVLDEQPAPGLAAQGGRVVTVFVDRHDLGGLHVGISELAADVPLFRSEADARASMETDEYRTIVEVLRSATVRP